MDEGRERGRDEEGKSTASSRISSRRQGGCTRLDLSELVQIIDRQESESI